MTAHPGEAYRRWRRLLVHARSRDADGSPWYVAYVVLALCGVYGSMAWSFVSSLGLGGASGEWEVRRLALLAAGAATALAVLAAGAGVPVWVTRLERVYALGGQFPARVVLRGRIVVLLAMAAALGALCFAAAASGGGSAVATALWAAWGAAAGIVALALGAVAQVARWRARAAGAAVGLLAAGAAVASLVAGDVVAGTGLPGDPCRDALGSTAAGCVGAPSGPGLAWLAPAVLAAVAATWAVLVAVATALDVDDVAGRGARALLAGEGMAVGDTLAASRMVQVRNRGPRGLLRMVRGRSAAAVIVGRDLVGLRRRLPGVLLATGAGIVGVWCIADGVTRPASSGPVTATVVTGALLLHAASLGWCGGLAGFLRQPQPGGLLPSPPWRSLLAHLAVPAALLAIVIVAGGGIAAATGSLGRVSAPTAASLAALALAARTWSLSVSLVPVSLYTPAPTPMGDMSVAVVLGYHLRGWLLVGGAAWIASLTLARGATSSWIPVLVAAAACLLTTTARVGRG